MIMPSARSPPPPSLSLSLSTLIYLTLAFSAFVFAQDVSFLPSEASSSFPACALTCSLLVQADKSCTPPDAQVTNRQTYVSCFCQSHLLANLRNSAQGTCDNTCSQPSDRTTLQQWYIDFCNSGGKTGTGTDADATSTTGAPTRTPAPAPASWWSGHYQWVIMVIVLVIGFTIITIAGVWLKRRHDAKYPHLYHAAATGASDSRIFGKPARDSPVPGPLPPALGARHPESGNTDSIASSSRTEVVVPKARPPRTTGRLQKALQESGEKEDDGMEIREIPR